MNAETRNPDNKLEKPQLTEEKAEHPYSIRRNLNAVITNFVYMQIEELVKFGISRSVSEFNREAIKEKINRHKHLLPDKFLNPKERSYYQRKKRAQERAKQKDEE